MILNNTKERIVGVVKYPDVKTEYTGTTTSTAKVTIDPETKEIKVDVIASGLLGETATTAYPGNDGALATKLAVKALENIEEETARAKEAEFLLKEKVEAFKETIDLGDAKVQTRVEQETQRAVAAEAKLQEKLNDLTNGSAAGFNTVYDKLVEVNNVIDKTRKDLSKDIRQLEDDIFDELVDITDNLSIQIDNVESSLESEIEIVDLRVSEVESTYATKSYVYEEVHNAITLSKQLVDNVDLINNTVIINSVVSSPIDGVLYMLLDSTSSVEDIYKEYTTIDGKLTLIGDTSISLDGYATEEFVKSKIDAIPEVDLTDYAKKQDIPDVSSFIAEIPEEYITEEELDEKGFYTLTQINDLLKSIEFIDGGNAPSL